RFDFFDSDSAATAIIAATATRMRTTFRARMIDTPTFKSHSRSHNMFFQPSGEHNGAILIYAVQRGKENFGCGACWGVASRPASPEPAEVHGPGISVADPPRSAVRDVRSWSPRLVDPQLRPTKSSESPRCGYGGRTSPEERRGPRR